MDHKFKSLLQNVPTRHVISSIKTPDKIAEQLTHFRKLDIVNFFILGSLTNIKHVLDAADTISFFNRKFAWHAITQDKGDLKCNCKNATIIFARPIVDTQYQDRHGLIKTSYQLNEQPEIAAAFYFDLALHTFLAARDLIADGSWKRNNITEYITCDDYDGKNSPKRFGLDLRKYFAKSQVQLLVDNNNMILITISILCFQDSTETPTYGPMKVTTNGESFMEFSMQISAIGVRGGSSDKSILLGTWKAGFDGNLSLIDPKVMNNYTADVVYRIVTVVVSS